MLGRPKDDPAGTLRSRWAIGIVDPNYRLIVAVVSQAAGFHANSIGTSCEKLNLTLQRLLQDSQLGYIGLKAVPVVTQCLESSGAVRGHEQVSGQRDHNRRKNGSHDVRHLHQLQ